MSPLAGNRVPLERAEPIARDLVEVLGLGCERIAIAGSIRRRMPDVGDIEIVAVPRLHTEPDGLFGSVDVDELQVVVDTLLMDGTLANHPTDPKRGPRYCKLIHTASGIQVDLWSASAERFGLIWLIRTGPATYSRWLVTEARRRGHHVAGGELHKGAGDCWRPENCESVPTPEEDDVIRALKLAFLPVPEQRA